VPPPPEKLQRTPQGSNTVVLPLPMIFGIWSFQSVLPGCLFNCSQTPDVDVPTVDCRNSVCRNRVCRNSVVYPGTTTDWKDAEPNPENQGQYNCVGSTFNFSRRGGTPNPTGIPSPGPLPSVTSVPRSMPCFRCMRPTPLFSQFLLFLHRQRGTPVVPVWPIQLQSATRQKLHLSAHWRTEEGVRTPPIVIQFKK